MRDAVTSQNAMDTRRVCELTAAELLEAAVQRLSGLGLAAGRWRVELDVDGGRLRRLNARPWPGVWCGVSLGRDDLSRREAA